MRYDKVGVMVARYRPKKQLNCFQLLLSRRLATDTLSQTRMHPACTDDAKTLFIDLSPTRD